MHLHKKGHTVHNILLQLKDSQNYITNFQGFFFYYPLIINFMEWFLLLYTYWLPASVKYVCRVTNERLLNRNVYMIAIAKPSRNH